VLQRVLSTLTLLCIHLGVSLPAAVARAAHLHVNQRDFSFPRRSMGTRVTRAMVARARVAGVALHKGCLQNGLLCQPMVPMLQRGNPAAAKKHPCNACTLGIIKNRSASGWCKN